MADREVKLVYRITDEGTLSVLDEAGRKIHTLGTTAETTAGKTSSGFTRMQASVVTLNQALDLTARLVQGAFTAIDKIAIAPIQEIDNYAELAKSIGLSVTELTSLRVAAKQGGLELSELGRSVSFLQRQIVAAAGGGGKSGLFAALGIDQQTLREVRDGTRSVNDVLVTLGRNLDSLPDGAKKTTVAYELLGRQGQRSLNVLTSALGEQIGLAREYGLVVNEDVAKSASAAADRIDEMSLAARGLGQEIAVALLPTVTETVTEITEWSRANRDVIVSGVSEWASGFGAVLRTEVIPMLKQTSRELDVIAGFVADNIVAGQVGAPAQSQFLQPYNTRVRIQQNQALIDAMRAENRAALGTSGLVVGPSFGDVVSGSSVPGQPGDAAAPVGAVNVEELNRALSGTEDRAKTAGRAIKEAKEKTDEWGRAGKTTTETFVELTDQIETAKRTTVDLSNTFGSSLTRSLEGQLNQGKFDIGDLVKGTGQSIATEFAGGFFQAMLAKNQFDLDVGENFTVTLPGFMQEGASLITDIWRGAMGVLTGDASNATTNIAGTFLDAFSSIGSQSTNLSGQLASQGVKIGNLAVSGSSQTGTLFTVADEFGTTFAGPSLSGVTGAASGVGGAGAGAGSSLGGVSAIGGAISGSAGALGAAAIAAYLGTNLITGALTGLDPKKNITLQNQTSSQKLRDESGLFGPGAIAAAVVVPLIGQLYALIAGIITAFIGAPSKGTQLKIGIEKSLPRSFPQQRDINIGDQTGIRTKFIEASPTQAEADRFAALGYTNELFPGLNQTQEDVGIAYKRLLPAIQQAQRERPEVDQLRYGAALGLGTVLAKSGQASSYSNAVVNNLLLSGVSEAEARRQLLLVAERNGVDFDSSIEELNKRYRNKRVFKDDPNTAVREDVQQFTAGITGLVDLFKEDIPAGVDVTAIAIKNFSDKAGIDIATFNKELDRAVEIFGALQQAAETGLKTGLSTAAQLIGKRNALIEGGGSVSEIIKTNLDARDALRDTLTKSLADGVRTAITEGVFDAVKESAPWKALTAQVAASVTSGDFSKIPALIGNVFATALPLLEGALAGLETLESLAAVTPTYLRGRADSLRGDAKDIRFNQLSPREQRASLGNELADIDRQIADLKAGGITAGEALVLSPLLDRRGQIGQSYIDQAANFAPGSVEYRNLLGKGLEIIDSTADLFEQFGISQRDALKDNTSALDRNTDAINNNTDVLTNGTAFGPAGPILDAANDYGTEGGTFGATDKILGAAGDYATSGDGSARSARPPGAAYTQTASGDEYASYGVTGEDVFAALTLSLDAVAEELRRNTDALTVRTDFDRQPIRVQLAVDKGSSDPYGSIRDLVEIGLNAKPTRTQQKKLRQFTRAR